MLTYHDLYPPQDESHHRKAAARAPGNEVRRRHIYS